MFSTKMAYFGKIMIESFMKKYQSNVSQKYRKDRQYRKYGKLKIT